jgi:hypothetical protein
VPESESFFKALAAEDDSLDGLNPHLAIIDELHAHRTRGVYDVLETATGSRSQSLLWVITTAGTNRVRNLLRGADAHHEDPRRRVKASRTRRSSDHLHDRRR